MVADRMVFDEASIGTDKFRFYIYNLHNIIQARKLPGVIFLTIMIQPITAPSLYHICSGNMVGQVGIFLDNRASSGERGRSRQLGMT
jgi:hypothetical protein